MVTASPETLGFSSSRLDRIHGIMQRYLDEQKLAGIVTLIARRGQVVHFEKIGMADIETSRPMQLDTIFRIYSMSKPITAAAVLMLFEEARLRLTDPVSRYIPAFKKMKVVESVSGSEIKLVDASREITIHDLLTHTSGLSYGGEEGVYVDTLYRKVVGHLFDDPFSATLQEGVEEIATLPLAHQPGTAFRYSVANDVLGCLVQVVSGCAFEDFLKDRIFKPLGMVDTGFYVPPESADRFSSIYSPAEKGGLKKISPFNDPRWLKPPRLASGGGGLVSTTSDYLRFAQMLLNGGEFEGARLLGRKTVELMSANGLPAGMTPWGDPAYGYGLGVSVTLDVGHSKTLGSAGTYGWSGAANTNFWIDPQEEMIGLLMLQFMPNDLYPVKPDFQILAYQALEH